MGVRETKKLLHRMVTRLKKQSTEWKKIFASYTSDKGLMTKIYRKLKRLNSQRISYPMKKKWANALNRFCKERITKNQKTHEEMLNIPGHKGNAKQNYIKIPPHPVKWLSLRIQTTNAGKMQG
jgi:hypothetical protein